MVAKVAPAVKVLKRTENQIISICVNEVSKPQPVHQVVIAKTDSNVENSIRSSVIGMMDNPGIDLTNGSVHADVEHCNRQFYLANYKQSYAMRRSPKGKAICLNVNEVMGKSPCCGTDINRDNLHNLVNLLVSRKVSHCPSIEMDQMSQMSEYNSTLHMPHLYFFPSIGGT